MKMKSNKPILISIFSVIVFAISLRLIAIKFNVSVDYIILFIGITSLILAFFSNVLFIKKYRQTKLYNLTQLCFFIANWFIIVISLLIASFMFNSKILLLFFLFATIIEFSLIVLFIAKTFRKNQRWKILFSMIALAFVFGLYSFLNDLITKPMAVRTYYLNGDYVINKDWFKGEDSDWQYNHYWLRISDDTLCLNIMKNGIRIKQYKRAIYYRRKGKHSFFEFYNCDPYSFNNKKYKKLLEKRKEDRIRYFEIKNMVDSIENINHVTDSESKARSGICDSVHQTGHHHALMQNPILHADPFCFNIILRSKKYGNMFFKKGNWKPID